jgi:hypothetical protein
MPIKFSLFRFFCSSKPLFFSILAFSFCSTLLAEEDAFPLQPPQNFSLFIKQNLVHHPVTTSQLEAQHFFDQGFTLIYAFIVI